MNSLNAQFLIMDVHLPIKVMMIVQYYGKSLEFQARVVD